MAESSSEPKSAADVLIEHGKEKPTFSTETSKEFSVTVAADGPGRTLDLDIRVEAQSGNSDGPLHAKVQKEEETTSTESSPENGTITTITKEEESVSVLLRHMKTEGGEDGDPGKSPDQVVSKIKKEKKKRTFIRVIEIISLLFFKLI